MKTNRMILDIVKMNGVGPMSNVNESNLVWLESFAHSPMRALFPLRVQDSILNVKDTRHSS
jgi:hypothetical protein